VRNNCAVKLLPTFKNIAATTDDHKEVVMKSHFQPKPTNNSHRLSGSLSALFTLGMLALMSCATAWAGPAPTVQLLTPRPTFQGILEGTGPAIIDFPVKNNSGVTLILDYAFCAIAHGGPDTDDYANFSGNNGDGGLLSGSLILLPNQVGHYIYSFTSPGDGLETDNDFGLDPVTFSIEMSPLGNHTPPPINNISSAIGFVAWVDQGGYNPPNLVALNDLFNFQNPQPQLLYANGIIGTDSNGSPFALSTIKVSDTPEPSTLLMLGSSLLAVGGFMRKRLSARG
jgi:PEP-CTERM motif